MAAIPWNACRKRKPLRAPKVKDCRPDGDRLRDREQRIARVQLIERLFHSTAETRDAAP